MKLPELNAPIVDRVVLVCHLLALLGFALDWGSFFEK
jgi:hypothetical protein